MSASPAESRIVFHVDLDAFFAAVERAQDPSLIGKPLIIGGLGPRGVVSCASYEVRPYGVHSAMPMARARRLCPHAVFLSGRHEVYREVSGRFMAILRQYTPAVQPVSVDEAYMDMTGTERLFGPAREVAQTIRTRVQDELNVTASIGIASSRLVAKIASDACKPDGLLEVPASESAAFLAPMPVRKLPGIGPRAAEALSGLGIRTLGELAAFPPGPLRRVMGPQAEGLIRRAQGVDTSPVETDSDAKSISAETTFSEDSDDREFLLHTLQNLSERVGARLRRSGKHARSVSLKLRFKDFSTFTRRTTLPTAIDGDAAISAAARSLLDQALQQRPGKVRLLGVGVESLTEPAMQLSFLDTSATEDAALSDTLDAIRDRFGRNSVKRGA